MRKLVHDCVGLAYFMLIVPAWVIGKVTGEWGPFESLDLWNDEHIDI
jgi:hypothetical protein